MEYISINKSVFKVIKQLLNYSSKDTHREDLCSTVKVDLENGTLSSADGFKLLFVKMTDELKSIFKENGVFKIQTGTINYKPVITLEKFDGHYPDLNSIMSSSETFIKFGVNPYLLREALQYVGFGEPVQFIIHKYENMKPEEGITIPIEMRFSVGDCDANAVIMPMHMSECKRWGVKE